MEYYIGLVLVAAFMFALNMHYIHSLAKVIHPYVNAHYSHFGFLLINGVMCNLSPYRLQREDASWSLVLIVLAIVVVTVLTQYSITLANTFKSPSLVMPFGYMTVLVSFWADVYLFGTEFTLLPIVGMLLTSIGLLSGYLVNIGSTTEVSVE